MATVLTVDDSPSIRQMIKVTLEPAGHSVIEAGDGAQGLAQAQAKRPDIVITDLNMPTMNGLELIRALRKQPTLTGLPIVFLTTESNEAVKQEAKSVGARGWITKPFKPEQLLAVVAKLVRTCARWIRQRSFARRRPSCSKPWKGPCWICVSVR